MTKAMARAAAGLWVVTAVALTGCQSQNKLAEERNELWKQNQALQSQLGVYRQRAEAAEADRARLASELEAARAAQPAAGSNVGFAAIEGVEVIPGPGTVTVRVPGDVLFASGKADLKPTAMKTLDRVADEISRAYPGKTVRVEGYTDSDAIRKSPWKDNLELSLQRAAAVHRYLQEHGIQPDQMYAAGFGAARPRASKDKSRRVEIVVVLND